MPRLIEENGQIFILYDDCEEYIYIGGNDPGYVRGFLGPVGLFIDTELTSCCQGQILDNIPFTPTPTPTVTTSVTPTITPTISATITPSPTLTPSTTPSLTPSVSITPSITQTISQTCTPTPTISITPSVTPTVSLTATNTPSITPSISLTPTVSLSVSITPTITPTISATASPTPTITATPTITPSNTATPTPTPSPTPTEILTSVNGVDRLQVFNSAGDPYEIISMDYGIPISEILPLNNHILASCVPLNNYQHKIFSDKLYTYSLNEGNILISTDNYFTEYDRKQTIPVFNTNSNWNNNFYPAGRVSSVNFNKDLNRWFLGAQGLEGEGQIFLYGFDNGATNKFYIGGDNYNSIYTGDNEVFSFRCGPTNIFSVGNSVILSNSYHILIYTTTNINTDELYFNLKQLAFTCDTDISNGVCGIDLTDIPESLTKLYQHLATIVQHENEGIKSVKILYNTTQNNNITIDNADYSCDEDGLTASDKGYYLSSYDFTYTIYTINSDSDISQTHKQIKIEFSKDINFDLINDVTLIYNGRSVGRGINNSNWTISGSGKNYLISANDTVYSQMIGNQKGYNLIIDLSAMSDNTIPNIVEIPLYQADLGFTVTNNYFRDIRSETVDTPSFIVKNEDNTILEYFLQPNILCDCGYTYNIKSQISATDFILCVSDIPGAYNDSEIKCILSKGQYIYYLLQQKRDPENISSDSSGIYGYNLYRADITAPNQLSMIAYNFKAIRRIANANRDITNNWSNTSIIDDNYILIGVPNSNIIFRIDYNNLSIIQAPEAISVTESAPQNYCNIADNDCFSDYLSYRCGCSFSSVATITGQTSGSIWRAFSVTFNGYDGNCDNNNDCYFIVSRGSNSLNYEGSSIEQWQLGEQVTIIASIGSDSLNVDSAFICYKEAGGQDLGSGQYDKLILKCTGEGLSGLSGYSAQSLSHSINNEFVP